MERLICLVIGYVFGLFQTAFFYGKAHGIDIREHGSGNAGTTNALRVLGTKAGLIVFAGDCLKCMAAVWVSKLLFGASHPESVYLFCLYAGAGVMNYTPVYGWYYRSVDDRAPAWTSVIYLHRFLTSGTGPGPYGVERPLLYATPGDVVQMSFDGQRWAHSMLVTDGGSNPGNILLSTHSYNALNRPMDSYAYRAARLIHILGVRI